ncbi:MAG TPA: ABC transporter permease [Pyrinomonadaceae bacterium]|jgi:putative ABC transport system permease protein|nr:ABC transporter permease [Pyrinomonadaceae bacterium]
MTSFWQDLRYGVRMLARSPGFTLIAVAALALGIGANTALFSVVNATLLKPLPYNQADRLVMVWEHNRPRNKERNVVSPTNFLDWQEQSTAFEQIAAFYDTRFNLTGAGEPEEIPAQVATGNLFTLLGAEAVLGRTFTNEDAEPGHDNVVVLSYGLWQRRFGGARDVIGKSLALNGQSATIIGVMPDDFKWFIKQNSLIGKPAELWTPTKFTNNTPIRGRFLSAVARLKPGVSIKQAQSEMSGIAGRLEKERPDFNTGWGVNLVPLREQLVGEIKTSLWVLLGAVGFVLLIACANVANLTLARAASRQKEIAIRTALGAGRWRVMRQLLTESIMLAVLGGAAGLLIALWGVDALVALSPRNLIETGAVGLSLPVLGFTFIISLLTGIIFGLIPALEVSRLNLNETLKETGKSNMGSPRSRRLRNTFVVAEVALALLLLVGAGLMIKSFMRLQDIDPGFKSANLLTMGVSLPETKYREDGQKIAFFRQAVERLEALPGVRSVGTVSALPIAALGAATSFTIEGHPPPAPGDKLATDVRAIDENYFNTMGIPLVNGRTFNKQEAIEDRKVAVVNETMARKYFPGEDPIGKRLLVNMKATPELTEIIGVVGDAKYDKLEGEPRAMVYWTHPELVYSSMTIVMRTTVDPLSLAAAAQREIQAIDKDQPVSDVRTMESWLAESVSRTRFGTMLLGLFAGIALILAAVGIYGVMAYSVNQRTQEIGIRMALGAQRSDVIKLIVGQGMSLTLIGVAIGLIAAFALTRVMSSLLYGVSATDPLTFIGISLLLTVIALLACYLPARKATRVDPMDALRYE